MKKHFLIFGPFWLALAVVLVILYFAFEKLDWTVGEEIIARYPSADKRYIVTVSIIEAGATTDFYTNVSIIKSDHSPDEKVKVLFDVNGKRAIDVVWKSERLMLITYEEGDVYYLTKQWHDVQIEYSVKKPAVDE